uniref:Secreted protein n=1 Tax=Ascaris lumbricoides TaxID=6252 RepID=A0A9J2Q422_ASCLU
MLCAVYIIVLFEGLIGQNETTRSCMIVQFPWNPPENIGSVRTFSSLSSSFKTTTNLPPIPFVSVQLPIRGIRWFRCAHEVQ